MTAYRTVLRTAELGPGEVREVKGAEDSVVLTNVGQTYYALAARCPVDGTNLAREGRLAGDHLVCPRDGTRFDVATGAAIGESHRLRSYEIRVRGNEVQLGEEKSVA
ncbi:MAG TPA: Rieske 2Fe-2S domain-containing protein [Longimicrobiales bacterium]|nr:Rieske 2Fe-2S domain-containing protein [Longimicrobiales bacterium]